LVTSSGHQVGRESFSYFMMNHIIYMVFLERFTMARLSISPELGSPGYILAGSDTAARPSWAAGSFTSGAASRQLETQSDNWSR
jgi:hypothetical protein